MLKNQTIKVILVLFAILAKTSSAMDNGENPNHRQPIWTKKRVKIYLTSPPVLAGATHAIFAAGLAALGMPGEASFLLPGAALGIGSELIPFFRLGPRYFSISNDRITHQEIYDETNRDRILRLLRERREFQEETGLLPYEEPGLRPYDYSQVSTKDVMSLEKPYCPICYASDIGEAMGGLVRLNCSQKMKHIFCRNCIENWLIHAKGKRCPMCQTKLKAKQD